MAEEGIDLENVGGVELTPRQEASKEMALEVLSDARKLAAEKRLSQEARPTNFWWTFFGTERTTGSSVSFNALSLQALSEGREQPNIIQMREALSRAIDPKAKQEIEENIRYQEERVFVGLSGLDRDAEAGRAFGYDPADAVANRLLQDLGFLGQGKSLDQQAPGVKVEQGVTIIPHPTKPFTAEVRPMGAKQSGGWRVQGFNLHYIAPSNS